MSATNSTPNYELPIFEATDKPTWQGDFNEAMNKIDTAVSGAEKKADNNATNIGTQQGAISTLNQSVNSLSGNLTTLQNSLDNSVILISQNNIVAPNSVSFLYEGAGQNIYYNRNTTQFLGSFYVSSFADSVTVEDVRTPLIKIPKNLFGLNVSTMGDNNNKYVLCDTIIIYSEGDTPAIAKVKAYYDGTNTIIFIGTSLHSTPNFSFVVNVTTLNAGVIS